MRPPTDPRDHEAWLAYWGEQAVAAIRRAIAQPDFVYEDHRLRYAINCARIAHHRALKVRPGLYLKTDVRVW